MAPNMVETFGALTRSLSGRSGSKRRLLAHSHSSPVLSSTKGGKGAAGAVAAATGAGESPRPATSVSSSASSSPSRAVSSGGAAGRIRSPAQRQRVALATAAELAVPPIAWPTVGVFLLGVALYVIPPLLTWSNPSVKTIPIQAFAVYLLFTPLHDAVHRAISTRKHRWVNELIGWVCALVFLAPFPGFRHIHLEHHKHTNVVGRDPDMWSSGGPWHATVPTWMLPVFWSTQQLYYYVWYLDRMLMRPLSEAYAVSLFAVALITGLVWLLVHGLGLHFLYLALFPYLVAGTGLAYSFDYAPHRPHEVDRFESIYACTAVLGGIFDPDEDCDLGLLLMCQNHHNIHHLYPQIPFYRYKVVWQNHEKELRALGTPIANWLGPLKMK